MTMLTFRDNPDRTFKLTEKYDLKDMRRFLLSDLIDADGKRALQKYLKQLDNGQVEVVYSSKALGRLEGKIDKLKSGDTCKLNQTDVLHVWPCARPQAGSSGQGAARALCATAPLRCGRAPWFLLPRPKPQGTASRHSRPLSHVLTSTCIACSHSLPRDCLVPAQCSLLTAWVSAPRACPNSAFESSNSGGCKCTEWESRGISSGNGRRSGKTRGLIQSLGWVSRGRV